MENCKFCGTELTGKQKSWCNWKCENHFRKAYNKGYVAGFKAGYNESVDNIIKKFKEGQK